MFFEFSKQDESALSSTGEKEQPQSHWENLLDALIKADFQITATLPVRTELPNDRYDTFRMAVVFLSQTMNVGRFLSEQSKDASYGDGYVSALADYIQQKYPGIKGFTRRGLYRMKQFYELYAENEKVSTLLTQLSWSNHLLIMSGAKSDEEREFYMRLSIKERYSYRELER